MTRHIRRDPLIMHGQPCISRIPTEAIYDLAQAGWTYSAIRSEFPDITRVEIDACVRYERSPRRRLARRFEALRTRLVAWLYYDERY